MHAPKSRWYLKVVGETRETAKLPLPTHLTFPLGEAGLLGGCTNFFLDRLALVVTSKQIYNSSRCITCVNFTFVWTNIQAGEDHTQ